MGQSIYAINLGVLVAGATILWSLSLRSKNVNIVDVGWGMGFVLVAWISWFSRVTGPTSTVDEPTSTIYPTLIALLTTVWGLRLSGYLAWRNWGKGEDPRYAAMRSHWGEKFAVRSLLTVFGLQAVLIWFISLSIQIGINGSPGWQWMILVGIAVWVTGWLFETIGDWQMFRFKKNSANRGRVMDQGLWRWTRHPNYFGDFLVWWGLYLISAQAQSWWWTISGPLLMSFLLLRVSGVKLLESSLNKRLDGYEDYIRRTSSFFPWKPKAVSSQRN